MAVIPLERPDRPDTAALPPQAEPLLDRMASLVQDRLRELCRSMFENVDDFLFDLADKAESQQQQTTYFDAMRLVRLRRQAMEDALAHAVRQVCGGSAQPVPVAPLPASGRGGSESWGLVDNHALEEELAVHGVAAKGHSLFGATLFELTQRMNGLAGRELYTDATLPFGPVALTAAFRQAMDALGCETPAQVRLAIYKLFERFVMERLGALYADLNRQLQDAGILPSIRLNVTRAETRPPRPAPRVAPTEDWGDDPVAQQVPGVPAVHAHRTQAYGDPVFAELHAIFLQGRGEAAAPVAITRGGYAYGDLVAALSAMQAEFSAAAEATEPMYRGDVEARLVAALGQRLKSDGPPVLAPVDASTVDMVGTLFEFILDDPNLAEPMKALLARLQIPVVKVALVDKTFFSQKNHPARRLLNELARAGMAWSERDDFLNDPLYAEMARVVERVVGEFVDDISLFMELLEEFRRFQEKEVQADASAFDSIELQKAQVHQAIDEQLAGRVVPPVIEEFLRGPWFEVLREIQRRDEITGESWQAAAAAVENLLWSVEPKSSPTERRLLAVMIPQLISDLQEGLALISFDYEARDQFLRALERCHLASLRGVRGEARSLDGAAEPDENNDVLDEIILETPAWDASMSTEITPELAGAAALAGRLALGSWVEFTKGDGSVRRGKLVWKDDRFQDFTFIDRNHKVIADMRLPALAGEFAAGRARRLDSVPLLDRAMDGLMKVLNLDYS